MSEAQKIKAFFDMLNTAVYCDHQREIWRDGNNDFL